MISNIRINILTVGLSSNFIKIESGHGSRRLRYTLYVFRFSLLFGKPLKQCFTKHNHNFLINLTVAFQTP